MSELKTLASILVYNNGKNAENTLLKIPEKRNFDVVIIDDCSTDDTPDYIKKFNFPCIRHQKNIGIGGGIKTAVKYAKENKYDVICILAGNDKDDPGQIERLLKPILTEDCDYVQGSRNISGGTSKNLPLFRKVMIGVAALIFRILTGFPCTDTLNGFRAYKLSIFNDPRININQDWLDTYEFETYLHYKVLKYKYKVKEVPVSKDYPADIRNVKYSHIRPFVDWWKIVRPLVYLTLKIKN